MGAWSHESFGNDSACDWAGDFCENPGLAAIERALASVFAEEYIESDAGSSAIAAAEVVARLRGNWGLKDAYSESIDAWVEQNAGLDVSHLTEQCGKALDAVLGNSSELQDLWGEAGTTEWQDAVADLRKRAAE